MCYIQLSFNCVKNLSGAERSQRRPSSCVVADKLRYDERTRMLLRETTGGPQDGRWPLATTNLLWTQMLLWVGYSGVPTSCRQKAEASLHFERRQWGSPGHMLLCGGEVGRPGNGRKNKDTCTVPRQARRRTDGRLHQISCLSHRINAGEKGGTTCVLLGYWITHHKKKDTCSWYYIRHMLENGTVQCMASGSAENGGQLVKLSPI